MSDGLLELTDKVRACTSFDAPLPIPLNETV